MGSGRGGSRGRQAGVRVGRVAGTGKVQAARVVREGRGGRGGEERVVVTAQGQAAQHGFQ